MRLALAFDAFWQIQPLVQKDVDLRIERDEKWKKLRESKNYVAFHVRHTDNIKEREIHKDHHRGFVAMFETQGVNFRR